ncbi:MAG: hypothetical protein ACYDBZ_11980 [Steroidobacteraceae bacterium]
MRFISEARMVMDVFEAYVKELVMPGFKRFVRPTAAAALLACAPILPAVAGGHGFGHVHGWGLGRGLVGAVVGLATLPLVIASAAIAATVPGPGYAAGAFDGPRGYAPRAYAAPRAYSAPASGRNYYGGHGSYRSGGYAYPRR